MESQKNIQNINKSALDYLKKYYLWHFISLCIFVAGLYVFLVMTGKMEDAVRPAIIPAIIFVILFGVIYKWAFDKVKHIFMREFAASIGYSYSQTGEGIDIKGRFSAIGHDKTINDVLSGIHDNLPIKIFLYSFTVGSGKSAQMFSYTVFEITFHSKMPGIILNSKNWQSLTYEIKKGEYLQLEGDFNKYFSLWVTKEFEAEAYQIFTPDVMLALIEKARNLSFEFIDDKLYIYTGEIINTKVQMENIFSLVDYLIDLFKKTVPNIHID